ncbi:hypothetical protein AAZX31_08G231500 [Glycine max]|uniref:Alpha-amylase/subtilisin inhibitor n=2 Tax=Glycine subgen. Soja TaxID=1462606 RepID=I1KW53_SOYBN|nr:trypsin inhibitor (Kunitz) family of protease inhibitors precursor [Glycine max]XP_028246963.1 alpha-amylase/subtilisin inhibitor-like [Glycine soja]KAH1052740.1 hypothetical protein GYH30_022175 [Glycine max]KRH44855.1 hypothetical protein GLYMA_08G235300v4 [Glycine max]RZB98461.1 Alpha-amylase/subtilisin inhibitor [Glycine soja]|eukprot:NP_001237857.2 trypsin inhibitor (Kunitz) family of protease inhibitors precursor [Glycine max]
MSMKLLLASLSISVWLFMATLSLAQSNNRYVFDTHGDPLETDDEYYIRPAITDNGGRFTLINRNRSCPLYVGLENTDTPQGYPMKFTPFANKDDDDNLRVNTDLKVTLVQVSTTCVQSTEWKLGENDTRSGRRLIVTGRDNGIQSAGNYFRIVETESVGIYNIRWCPTEACPTCRFICGTGGILRENGRILFALDGTTLPVVFQKKDD